MENPTNRSLVPIPETLPATLNRERKPREGRGHAYNGGSVPALQDFSLVQRETYLRDTADVEKFLPDILGRALARIWIDIQFRDKFAAGPKETLAEYGVYLPRNFSIDFVTEGTPRPQIVVYEQRIPGGPRRRLMYLRLMMMAGR